MIAPKRPPTSPEDQTELCEYSEVDLTTSTPSPSIWLSKRFFLGILLFFGYLVYSMACQVVNIALVEMTVSKRELVGNQTIVKPPEFDWSSKKVAVILNMFWYGYMFSSVGGYLAQKFGGSVVLGVSTLLTGILTVATSFSVYLGFHSLLACRGLVGLFEGFSSASYSVVFASWVPKKERSSFMSAVINGMYVGTAVVYPFCGYLTRHWGWPMAFHAVGAISIAWAVLWLILIRNTPSTDRWISKAEQDYIIEGTHNAKPKKSDQPYKQIFKSPSFWALSMSKFAFNWASAFTVVYLPVYIKDVTQKDISQVGVLSSIPNFNILIVPIIGGLTTFWQNHTALTTTQIHKIIICGGFILSAALFAAIAVMDNFVVSILCFIVIKLLLSCNKIFLEVITVNMAPNHSGLLSGLTLFWQTVGIIVIQTIVGFIVQNHSLQEWNTCFLSSAGVTLMSGIVFLLFGSSDPQPWSVLSSSENYDENLYAK